MEVQMSDIYSEGDIYSKDDDVTIYMTPTTPLTYDNNKWVYHQMPDVTQFKEDMKRQQSLHADHGVLTHLKFEFPENVKPNIDIMQLLRAEGFQVGNLELYMIEAADLRQLTGPSLEIEPVTIKNMADYMHVYEPLSIQFGADYIKESAQALLTNLKKDTRALQPYIAYENAQPIGIMNVIETERTVELDGFAVAEAARGRGVGSRMQAFMGGIARERPVILVADAEDTAREMYMKQGYTFVSFQYSALKELTVSVSY
ncbi:GNAT family N-acetyltransferase [Staphylococcus pseudintermedius]|uniref:GNAT family N-acetyltransferase n=1 Tax=Staphylococcus pseudintermedius TaxID=283734 RepID=UPI001BDECA0E|nr:GNAT family N-acetyltransferase [Staphylococcus pseudintermedius]